MEVPSLCGIRELAHTEPTKTRRAGPTWSPVRGIAFVVGMLVAVFGLFVAAYALLAWLNLDTSEPLPEDLTASYASIDQKTPEDMLLMWQGEILNRGMEKYQLPAHVAARVMSQFFGRIAMIGLCVTVIGAAVSASTIVFRKS